MPLNPRLTGDMEAAISFFENRSKRVNSIETFASAYKPQLNITNSALGTMRGSFDSYPASGNYKQDATNELENRVKSWYYSWGKDIPSLDIDFDNMDMSIPAFNAFNEVDSIEDAFHNTIMTAHLMECLIYSSPEQLMQTLMQLMPQTLLQLIAFMQSAVEIFKADINSYRDAILGLLMGLIAQPLSMIFTKLDQAMAMGMKPARDAVNMFSIPPNPYCSIKASRKYYEERGEEFPEKTAMEQLAQGLEQAKEYGNEGLDNIKDTYNFMKDELWRMMKAAGGNLEDTNKLMKKIAVLQKIYDMLEANEVFG